MRVLVTGATGFVGSHVARLLVRHGHEVHALVREGEAEDRLAEERLGVEGEKVARIRGDLLEPASWSAAIDAGGFDACVHLGWYANPKDYLSARVNVDLLNASAALGARLVDAGCRRIVMAGACFEYDVSFGFLSESTPAGPRHLYSACKRSLFEIMSHLVSSTPTSFAWTRLFFLYGPHESRGRLVPAVVDALLAGEQARVTTGEQFRDFMHVADAAAAIVHVLEHDELVGPVNIASGRPVRVREVVETIAGILDAKDRVAWGAVQARPNDPGFVCADVSKLAASGFRAQHDLESGLRDTIAWSKAQRASALRATQE